MKLPIRGTMKLPIRRPWIPYIILIISLMITVLATLFVVRTTQERDRLRFQSAVEQTQSNIDNRVDTYVALLRGTSSLFATRADITQEEFQTYVANLRLKERYPGIIGIGYAPRVRQENRDAFIAQEQAAGNEDFTIRPGGERPDYYPIMYLEPTDTTKTGARGYDAYSELTRRTAMDRARDTGVRSASGKVSLVQESDQRRQAGFLIYVPLYEGNEIPPTIAERREKIRGFVYSPFRANDLLTGIFGTGTQQMIHFQVYDGPNIRLDRLLHDSEDVTNTTSANYQPTFRTVKRITIAGETWTLAFTNTPQFEQASQRGIAPFILIGGLLISFVLFLLSRSEFLARKNAEQIAAKLFHSQRELQKAIGIRDNFISIASHELKTPVTSIKVYTEVMLRQFTKRNMHQEVTYLTRMNNQIDKLTMLIRDLLDVSRLQAGKLALREESFELSAVVKDVVENTQTITDHHTIMFKASGKYMVWGDKERIGQVVSNFLTNAIKYSPKADKVKLSVTKTNNHVTVAVQDFGIGIDKQYQSKIFNRFYRVSDTKEQTYPGLGMGLYICHEIIKRHGGEITVTSVKGKGSTFSFTLPLKNKNTSSIK